MWGSSYPSKRSEAQLKLWKIYARSLPRGAILSKIIHPVICRVGISMSICKVSKLLGFRLIRHLWKNIIYILIYHTVNRSSRIISHWLIMCTIQWMTLCKGTIIMHPRFAIHQWEWSCLPSNFKKISKMSMLKKHFCSWSRIDKVNIFISSLINLYSCFRHQ